MAGARTAMQRGNDRRTVADPAGEKIDAVTANRAGAFGQFVLAPSVTMTAIVSLPRR
jgi:hypothetical protein